MKLRRFVSASAASLLVWLAITFVHEVPTQRYPRLDKYPATTLRGTPPAGSQAATPVDEPEVLQVFVSH